VSREPAGPASRTVTLSGRSRAEDLFHLKTFGFVRCRTRVVSGLVAALMLAGAGEPAGLASPAAWPEWRGPDGQGHAPSARTLPLEWSEDRNIVWKTPLPGRGWSSPVIEGGLVWLTTAVESPVNAEERARRLAGGSGTNAQPLDVSGPVSFRALAVDRGTGVVRRDIELFVVADPQPIHTLNSYASPSPVLADGRLFCHFGDYGTACVDTATGGVVWTTRPVRLDHENGPGSSPVLWRDLVIVHCDGSDTQSVVALDTRSGAVAWRTPRSGTLRDSPQLKKAYATPLVVPVDGRDVLVSPGADWLYGYDPRSGRELWKMRYGVLGFSVVPRPVTAHGLLFMSTSYPQPELLAVRLSAERTDEPAVAWREKRAAPTMSSPLVVGEELYMVSDKGVATCLDARSGAVRWTQRLGGNFSSSPLLADGRIYLGNRDGRTFVLEPGPEFRLAATNQLEGRIFATPAAVDRALYLRTDAALYRIERQE
jgi:outer membrane protein assembly factor BamB